MDVLKSAFVRGIYVARGRAETLRLDTRLSPMNLYFRQLYPVDPLVVRTPENWNHAGSTNYGSGVKSMVRS